MITHFQASEGVQLARERHLPSNATGSASSIAAVPLLEDRGLVDGRQAAYLCRDFACQVPATTPHALEGLLGAY
jgi:hypothetical protein